MGRLPTGNRRYNIELIQNRHQEIIRYLVLGWKHGDIATYLNCTPQNVSDVANSPLAKAQIDKLQAGRNDSTMEIQEEIIKMAPKAIEVLNDTLTSEYEQKLKVTVAQDVLDRAGFKAASTLNVRGQHLHMTTEDIEKLKQRARSVAKPIESVEYEVQDVEAKE